MKLKNVKIGDLVQIKLGCDASHLEEVYKVAHVEGLHYHGCYSVFIEYKNGGKWVNHCDIKKYKPKLQSETSNVNDLYGSDLTRAMISSGDNLVICAVSNISDGYSINKMRYEIICKLQGNTFISTTNGIWVYAVPVNRQGKLLTSKDVQI